MRNILFLLAALLLTAGLSACDGTETLPPELEKEMARREQLVQAFVQDTRGDPLSQELAAIVLTRDAPAHKDERRKLLVRDALKKDRFDAACAAALAVENPALRDASLVTICHEASQDKETLPWAALAASRISNAELAAKMREHTALRYEEAR